MNLAGFPAYIPGRDMSFVTTDPAPMTTLSHILTGRMVALDPIETLFPTCVAFQSSLFLCARLPLENVSLINMVPCEIKQSFPIVTSSHTKE